MTLILQLSVGLLDLGCLVETHAPLVQLQTDLPEVIPPLGHLFVLDLFPFHESGSGWTHVDAGLSGRLAHCTVAPWSPECRFDLGCVVVKLEMIFEVGHRFFNGIPLDVGGGGSSCHLGGVLRSAVGVHPVYEALLVEHVDLFLQGFRRFESSELYRYIRPP